MIMYICTSGAGFMKIIFKGLSVWFIFFIMFLNFVWNMYSTMIFISEQIWKYEEKNPKDSPFEKDLSLKFF